MIFPKVNEASLNKGSFFHIYENEDFELYNILSQKEVIENQISAIQLFTNLFSSMHFLLPMIFKEWRLPTVYSKTVIFQAVY